MLFTRAQQTAKYVVLLLFLAVCAPACKKKAASDAHTLVVGATSAATGWTMSSPTNGSTSNIVSPHISGTFAIDAVIVSLYLTSDCSDAVLGTGTTAHGAFTIDPFTLNGDGLKTFYYQLDDGNSHKSLCVDSGLSYTLDTAPTPPTLSSPPTLTNVTSPTFAVSSCNDSTTYLISATTPSAAAPGWLTCSTTTGIPVTLTEGSNTIVIWGKNLAGKVSETSRTVTVTLDTIAPIAPTSWSMTPTTGTISTNATPTLSGSAAETAAVVSVYTTNNCTTPSRVGTGTVASGAFTISSFTLSTDGPYTFYYKIGDPAGNSTACATTGLTFTLDTTAPTSTSLTINGGDASTNFRNVTLTLSATETVSTPIQMCVAEDSDCSTCSFISYTTSKNITLSALSGSKTVSAKFRDSLGNVSACIHSSISVSPLTVSYRYSAAPNWNDYVKTSNTAQSCDGSETGAGGCIHGGEQRRVTSARTSCVGLAMTDALGAFDWTCSIVGGLAVFDSTIKPNKGLKDLITASAWQNNTVTLTLGSSTVSSNPAAWWSNTITPLTANDTGSVISLASSGTIYTLATSAQTAGYNIGADNIGVVGLSGATLSWNAGTAGVADNCSSDNGKTIASDRRCILAAGSQKFLWIEGLFDGGATAAPDYGVFLSSVLFSRIYRSNSNNESTAGFFLDLSSNNNTLTGVTAANNGAYGVQIDSSSQGNVLTQISTANNASYGLYINASSNNSATEVSANSNGVAGVYIRSSSSNTITRVTTNNHPSYGVYLRSATSNILSNIASANNGTGVFLISSSNFNTFSQLAAANNTTGVSLNASSSNKFTGNLLVGNNSSSNCSVTGGSNAGLVNTTCTSAGTSGSSTYPVGTASNAGLITAVNLASSWIGKVSADASNLSAVSGTATYASTLDWVNFATSQRQWGKDGSAFPNSNQQGKCSAGTCRIWDWTLSSSDVSILETSGDGISPNDPVSTGNCPSQVDGTQVLTDKSGTYNFLKNAVEILDDPIGNNNGLCESGEICIYTPNFGAYQGHGNLQQCTFISGTVTGVTMFWYSTNGR